MRHLIQCPKHYLQFDWKVHILIIHFARDLNDAFEKAASETPKDLFPAMPVASSASVQRHVGHSLPLPIPMQLQEMSALSNVWMMLFEATNGKAIDVPQLPRVENQVPWRQALQNCSSTLSFSGLAEAMDFPDQRRTNMGSKQNPARLTKANRSGDESRQEG